MPKELRYYQRDAIDEVEFGFDFYQRQVMRQPTGAGKTFTAAKLIERRQPERCLYLADQDELVQQPRQTIQEATGIIAAVEQGKDRASLDARVVIASSQSLARESSKGSGQYPRLERYPRDHFDLILSDECHRGTDRDAKVWEYFDNAFVCGMTATPFRQNMADLSKWFGRVAFNMDIMDLVEEGFAPPPLPLVLPVEIDLDGLKIKRGPDGKDYDKEAVESFMSPHYEAIANLIVENCQGRHGIAYLPLVSSSKAFAAILRSRGLRAAHIDGTSEDRDAKLLAFAHGDLDWLCNATLLSTGVDIPIADCFLNLRLTSSIAFFQQARGRVFRVLPGIIDHLPEKDQAAERRALIAASAKPNAMLLDLLLQNDRLGVSNVVADFARNQHDAKQLFERAKKERTPFDLMQMAKAIQMERETALVAALEKAAIRSAMGSPMTGEQVGALVGDRMLMEYTPIMGWEQEKPTRNQVEYLTDHGIDSSSIKSKGQASALISMFSSRANMGYSTVKQIKMIKQLMEFSEYQHPEPHTLTMQEASDIIDSILKSRRRVS